MEHSKLEMENKAQSIVTSSVSHDLIAPLKCISQMAKAMITHLSSQQDCENLKVIENTS